MVELLAGALIGDLFSSESSAADTQKVGAPLGGEFIIAIDPAHCCRSTNPLARAEQLFASVLEQPGTRLPSQRRYSTRIKHVEQGVDVSLKMLDELAALQHA